MIIVTAVSVFRVYGSRPEKPDLIIPHQGFLIDPVQGCELADRKQFFVFIHGANLSQLQEIFTINDTVTVLFMIQYTKRKYKAWRRCFDGCRAH